MEQPTVSTRTSLRRRPLETLGASALAIARIMHTRSQNLDGPTGSLAQKIIRIALSFAWITDPFKCHLLAIVSSADDHFLALQETLETHFPSSNSLFSKIQDFLYVTETLPEKLDRVLEKVPSLINQVAVLDCILVYAISWLDFLAGVLARWRDKNTKEKEKEILVDKSFSRSGSVFLEEEKKRREEKSRPENRRATYKETLQKGSHGKDGVSQEGDRIDGESPGSSSNSSSGRGDPILELFETGWILNPLKRSSRSVGSLTFSHSSSYLM